MTLDELLNRTEELKTEINNLAYQNEDVRHSFYTLYYTTVYDYYIGLVALELSRNIGTGDVRFTQEIYHLRDHVSRLHEISAIPTLEFGYHGALNRSVIFGSWTAFETCVDLIFKHLVTEEEIEGIIKKINSKLMKAVTMLEEEYKVIVIEILKKSSFIPLFRKFSFIVKQDTNVYSSNIQHDKAFLKLMGTVRNCMIHSNGLYYGSDFTQEFEGCTFEFKNGEIFTQTDGHIDTSFLMAERLKSIFTSLINCVEDIEFVAYPNDQRQD